MRGNRFNYETHVTVDAGADAVVLETVARKARAKVTEIVLARGETPHHPMITFTGSGTRQSQLKHARRLGMRLQQHGIEVVRVKLELGLREAFFCTDKNGRSKKRAEPPEWLYAEQHVRVRLRAGDLPRLQSDAVQLGAHVSANPRSSTGVLEDRYVTSRVYKAADDSPSEKIDTSANRDYWAIHARFEATAQGLRDAGWGVVSRDQELVVHDTNVGLDAGWLPVEVETEAVGWLRQSPSFWPAAWTLPADPVLEQPQLFDPAMKHLPNAYRRGNPGGQGSQPWLAARTEIFEAILAAVAASPLRDVLCVRGSVLLRRYLGDAGRVPGDIDWVVLPSTTKVNDEHGAGVIEALKNLLADTSVSGATLHVDDAVLDSIWTYDRVPGRRLVIPWSSDEVAPGTVQMDFVFGEELWTPPIKLPVDGEAELYLTAASPELSLAWKLLWLASDIYPQGKDLYDAVLLAEAYPISPNLVDRAFAEANQWKPRSAAGRSASREAVDHLPVQGIEWDTLITEYPQIKGTVTEWKDRLADALFPPIRTI